MPEEANELNEVRQDSFDTSASAYVGDNTGSWEVEIQREELGSVFDELISQFDRNAQGDTSLFAQLIDVQHGQGVTLRIHFTIQ